VKIIVGSDHAGFELKETICDHLLKQSHEVQNVGALSLESYNYPAASDAVAQRILKKEADFGVLICGSGVGVMIRANRYFGIRAVNCCSQEMAILSREHNQANVICFGARLISTENALSCLDAFLKTEPDPSPRHAERVAMLDSSIKF